MRTCLRSIINVRKPTIDKLPSKHGSQFLFNVDLLGGHLTVNPHSTVR